MKKRTAACANCAFVDVTNIAQPFCRRNPPSLVVIQSETADDNGVRKFWPVISPDIDWCGEFSPNYKNKARANAI